MRKGKLVEEKGEFTIEATIVMIVTMAVIFLIINMGFVIYHKQMVTAVATKTASDVAYIYGESYKEPFYGYMKEDYFKSCNPYRYFLDLGGLENTNIIKARWYACYYLSQYQFGKEGSYIKQGDKYEFHNTNGFYDGVKINVGKNAVGQKELTVDIEITYPVFTLNPVFFLGIEPNYNCYATATAICIDPMHDMMTTKLYQEVYNKIIGDSYTLQGVNQLATAVNKLVDLIRNAKKGK